MKIVTDQSQLRIVSSDVESVAEARDIILDLERKLVYSTNSVGIAAIQIGIPKRVGVIKSNTKEKEYIYLINPEVVSLEDEFIYFNEGCLSLPDIYHNTKRYKHVTIKNHIIDGDSFKEQTCYFYYSKDQEEMGNDGLTAIAVQHELDHFDGKLIGDEIIKSEPIIVTKKVGRNEKCPCGSGNKYKKCCGK